MPDLLQTTLPVLPKNYVSPTAKTNIQNDEIFDLVDLSKVIKTSERGEQAQQDNATFENQNIVSPKMPMLISKDPSYTAGSLKALLSNETISQLQNTGNDELAARLTEFANELMLAPEDVAEDLLKQKDTLSIFNGKFFDMLRNLASHTSNTEIRNSIAALLKSISTMSSSKEILNSISLNLKALAAEMYANKQLYEPLMTLSKLFASSQAMENFSELKNHVLSVLGEASQSILMNEQTKNIIPLIIYNLSRFQQNPSAIVDNLRGLLEFISSQSLKDRLMHEFSQFIENSDMSADIKEALLTNSQSAQQERQLNNLLENLIYNANLFCKNADISSIKQSLSGLNTSNGILSLQNILSQILPEGANADIQSLLSDFNVNQDLNQLINRLTSFLDGLENEEVKMALTQSLNEALNTLASKGAKYSMPSSMDNLAVFLSKNLNDSILRSTNAFNKQITIQNLLTAPGVFTPLSHYLLPLQYNNSRAFGELWVDNNSEGKGTKDEDATHFFLSFSIENIGDFELEVYAVNTELSINLLCPEDFQKTFAKIKDHISRIVAVSGFTPKETRIGPLIHKRNIVDVFPNLKEKRSGLNVTI